jgi:transcriptional regulator with XRE-family HTH domain
MTRNLRARLGQAFKKRRNRLQISQEGVAKRLKMHRTYYSAIERGKKNIQIDTFKRICVALDVRMWQVLRNLGR